jgi:hypothetical protein
MGTEILALDTSRGERLHCHKPRLPRDGGPVARLPIAGSGAMHTVAVAAGLEHGVHPHAARRRRRRSLRAHDDGVLDL